MVAYRTWFCVVAPGSSNLVTLYLLPCILCCASHPPQPSPWSQSMGSDFLNAPPARRKVLHDGHTRCHRRPCPCADRIRYFPHIPRNSAFMSNLFFRLFPFSCTSNNVGESAVHLSVFLRVYLSTFLSLSTFQFQSARLFLGRGRAANRHSKRLDLGAWRCSTRLSNNPTCCRLHSGPTWRSDVCGRARKAQR
jgi:hypothetical protein